MRGKLLMRLSICIVSSIETVIDTQKDVIVFG